MAAAVAPMSPPAGLVDRTHLPLEAQEKDFPVCTVDTDVRPCSVDSDLSSASKSEDSLSRNVEKDGVVPKRTLTRANARRPVTAEASEGDLPKRALTRANARRPVTAEAPPPRRRVSFSVIEVRSYEQVLGDHPDCSKGPPVQIGWGHSGSATVSVDDYEAERPRRRSQEELVIPYLTRRRIARLAGSSAADVEAAVKESERVKEQRLDSCKFSFGESVMSAKRNVASAILKRGGSNALH